MSFGIGLVLYILGSIAVAVCLLAIPGGAAAAASEAAQDHAHGH